MAYYYCLLLDADNTLLDFDEAERKALNETFTQFELPVDAETVALYDRINKGLWAALDRGEMKAEKLAVERFSRLGKELNRPLDAPVPAVPHAQTGGRSRPTARHCAPPA